MRLQFAEPAACVVGGCRNAPAAEMHVSHARDRSRMLRRWGVRRVFVCAVHEHDPEVNAKLGMPDWQGLLFA